MRKILTSVLSVAGLLAVVLALASSPAAAAKQVVTIISPASDNVGTYTVSWETLGGCDPGDGTSGASGSVTITVADDGTPNDGDGSPQQQGVVIDSDCNYDWSVSHVNAAGAACRITDFDTPAAGTAITLALTADGCAQMGHLAVTVKGSGTNVGDCIAAPDGDGGFDDDACATANTADPQAGGFNRATADDATDSAKAASATTFTITATPEEAANGNVPEGCNAVSEDTETDYDDNNLQKATLTVVDRSLDGAQCEYTVTAALPAGFAAGDGSARSTGNSQDDQNPAQNDGADNIAGNDDDNIIVVPDLTVSIAAAKVYLVQNVIGDAGGASVEYKYEAPCGAPGLPGALTATPASGGISTVGEKTVVELRTGRFNVSEALPDGTAADGVAATALDAAGDACEATVSVTGVPGHCSVSHNSPASLATADGTVIIEVTVDCSPPPAPEPMPEEPMDDTGDMGGDDMGGDDMGADDMGDMGGDDMGGDDMGDMGPPEDVATG